MHDYSFRPESRKLKLISSSFYLQYLKESVNVLYTICLVYLSFHCTVSRNDFSSLSWTTATASFYWIINYLLSSAIISSYDKLCTKWLVYNALPRRACVTEELEIWRINFTTRCIKDTHLKKMLKIKDIKKTELASAWHRTQGAVVSLKHTFEFGNCVSSQLPWFLEYKCLFSSTQT